MEVAEAAGVAHGLLDHMHCLVHGLAPLLLCLPAHVCAQKQSIRGILSNFLLFESCSLPSDRPTLVSDTLLCAPHAAQRVTNCWYHTLNRGKTTKFKQHI